MPDQEGLYRDLDQQIEFVLNEGELSQQECLRLCERARDVLQEEPNCVQVKCPVTIVGDLHGQFQDFKELLLLSGQPPETNYLFLGDYVDRGENSVKTVTLAFLLKARFRERAFLLRGNHECRQITQVYGFYDEVVRIYGSPAVWVAFTDAFDSLPLAAVVEGSIFCPHAGLSPSLPSIDVIHELDRFREVPHEGPMCDLLWSDPERDCEGWLISRRGAGYHFGPDISEEFNSLNGTKLIVRAHQVVMEGYEWVHPDQLVTVFSAPNYVYRAGNLAAVMDVDEHLNYSFRQYRQAPEQKERPSSSSCGRSVSGWPLPDYFEKSAPRVSWVEA